MTTPSTISYRRGDIVFVSFPFTDLTFARRRPALEVSPNIVNELNEDPILLAHRCSTGGLRGWRPAKEINGQVDERFHSEFNARPEKALPLGRHKAERGP
jgi:hypothetical protein